jgi:hypothetical protein
MPITFCIVLGSYFTEPKYDPKNPPIATTPIKGNVKSRLKVPD